jgi:hypothetical protein
MSFVDPKDEHPDIKKIDIAEFREKGYLHELNRRFLHPLGLALAIDVDSNGKETLAYIWDYREDPEGIYYDEDLLDPEKTEHIEQIWDARMAARIAALGYMVQPVWTVGCGCAKCEKWVCECDG